MKYFKIFIIFLVVNSCSYPKISSDILVYDNNFESEDLSQIDGGYISIFNNSKVVGDFNNDGFTLHLKETGEHEYVFVSLIYTYTVLGW